MSTTAEEKSQMLETKPVHRLLWEFAIPSIIAMCASSVYNVCDSIFIGRHSGSLAIAGMAITFPLMNILSAFSTIASVGGAAQASIHMGMKMRQTVHHILGNVLILNLFFATLLTISGILFLDPLLRLFGASDATLPYAHPYMNIIFIGTLPHFVFNSLSAMIRSTGYPRIAMTAQLLSVILNVLFDIVFIFGFNWGITGAAIATIIAQLCAMGYLLPHYFDRRKYLFFSRHVINVSWRYIREIVSIGISPFLSNISGCLIVAVINLSLLHHGGDLYISAYGITNRITHLLIMVVVGFSQGLQPVVGYNLGAERYDRVRGTIHQALLIATIITTVGYSLIALFPRQLVSLFTSQQELFDVCIPALRIALFTFPAVGSQMIAVAFFQSIRKAKFSVLISLSRQLCCLLPLLLWLPNIIGVNGVWWSMSLADFYSVLLSWILLWKMMHKIESIKLKRR